MNIHESSWKLPLCQGFKIVPLIILYWKWNIKKILKKSRSGKKLIGLAKLSYLQDPMSDRIFFLSLIRLVMKLSWKYRVENVFGSLISTRLTIHHNLLISYSCLNPEIWNIIMRNVQVLLFIHYMIRRPYPSTNASKGNRG
jgi:hypothetical protein